MALRQRRHVLAEQVTAFIRMLGRGGIAALTALGTLAYQPFRVLLSFARLGPMHDYLVGLVIVVLILFVIGSLL